MNDQNSDYYDEDDGDSDAFIDSLLDEYLNKRKPRDLDADQVAASIARATFTDGTELVHLDAAAALAALDVQRQFGLNPELMPSGASNSAPVVRSLKDPANSEIDSSIPQGIRKRLVYGVLAGLAASLLIVAGTFFGNDSSKVNNALSPADLAVQDTEPADGDKAKSIGEDGLETGSVPAEQIANSNSTTAGGTDVAPIEESVVGVRPLGELPFQRDRLAAETLVEELNKREVAKWNPNREQMLVTIDSQFAQLWDLLEIDSGVMLDSVAWADRVSEQLIGRKISETERTALQSYLQSGSQLQDAKSAWLDRLLSSDEFAEYWAEKLATNYFELNAPAEQNSSSIVGKSWKSAVEKIASAIRDDQPILPLWRDWLSVPDEVNIAGGIGAWWVSNPKRDPHSTSTRLLTRWQGTQASCAQCHAAEENVVEIDSNQRARYWAFAGLLHKFDLMQDDNRLEMRVQTDRELFYDQSLSVIVAQPAVPQADGSLKTLAEEAFNDADQLSVALIDWTEWAVGTDAAKQEFVDAIWTGMFRKPLQAKSALQSQTLAELSELREFLGKQLDSEDGSLRSILATLAMSAPFQTGDIVLSTDWYLTANDDQIRTEMLKSASFARYAPTNEVDLGNIDRMVAWLRQTGQTSSPRTVLANPTFMTPSKTEPLSSGAAPQENRMTSDQLAWLLESRHPNAALETWISKLSNSQMDWKNVVTHVYLSSLGRPPTSSELHSSDELLDLSASRNLAIARILASLSVSK